MILTAIFERKCFEFDAKRMHARYIYVRTIEIISDFETNITGGTSHIVGAIIGKDVFRTAQNQHGRSMKVATQTAHAGTQQSPRSGAPRTVAGKNLSGRYPAVPSR